MQQQTVGIHSVTAASTLTPLSPYTSAVRSPRDAGSVPLMSFVDTLSCLRTDQTGCVGNTKPHTSENHQWCKRLPFMLTPAGAATSPHWHVLQLDEATNGVGQGSHQPVAVQPNLPAPNNQQSGRGHRVTPPSARPGTSRAVLAPRPAKPWQAHVRHVVRRRLLTGDAEPALDTRVHRRVPRPGRRPVAAVRPVRARRLEQLQQRGDLRQYQLCRAGTAAKCSSSSDGCHDRQGRGHTTQHRRQCWAGVVHVGAVRAHFRHTTNTHSTLMTTLSGPEEDVVGSACMY